MNPVRTSARSNSHGTPTALLDRLGDTTPLRAGLAIMLAWWLTLILLAVSADAADELQISDLPESTTLFSTHPAIQYLPESDCIHRTLWWCSGRGYPWGNYDYLDQYTDQYRSFAVVTNEHNHAYGNPHREIVIKVPPGMYTMLGIPDNQERLTIQYHSSWSSYLRRATSFDMGS